MKRVCRDTGIYICKRLEGEEKSDLPFLTAIIARSRLSRVRTVLLVVTDVESAQMSKIMKQR